MAIDALTGPSHPPANGKPATAAVILLHGYGASGNDLIGLAPFFAQTLPHAIFYSPNAPHPWEGGGFGARQWFGLGGYDPIAMQRDPQALAARFNAMAAGATAAAGPLERYIDQVLDHHKLAPGRLALLGFSQGTMMSLYVGLRREAALGAILGYSGALVGADSLSTEIKSKPPVALVHGEADPVVPVQALAEMVRVLTAVGIVPETQVIPGLQHGIDPAGAQFGAAFLQKYLS